MAWFKKEKRPASPVDVAAGGVSESSQPLSERVNGFYNIETPKFDLGLLEILEVLGRHNPNFSGALSTYVNLGNTGHSLEVVGDDAGIEHIVERLNETSRRINRAGGGVHGLINKLIRQGMLMGAVSAEMLIAEDLQSVEDIVQVPVRSIRFKREGGRFVAYQMTQSVGGGDGDGFVKLNPFTYTYSPLMAEEGSPYGLPPFIAAIKPAEMQMDGVKNIAYVLKNLGLLGFLAIKMDRPDKKPGESDGSYVSRLTARIQQYSRAMKKSLAAGIGFHYDDQEIKYHSVAKEGRGAKDIFNVNEEQFMTALNNINPSLLGRSYSATETYAGVAYDMLISALGNVRLSCGSYLEKTYELDLLLSGVTAKVQLAFTENTTFGLKEKEEAAKLKVERVIAMENQGYIDEETAQNMLGLEPGQKKTRDENSFLLEFHKDKKVYVFTRDVIVVSSGLHASSSHAAKTDCGCGCGSLAKSTPEAKAYAAKVNGVVKHILADAATTALRKVQSITGLETGFGEKVFKHFEKAYLPLHRKKTKTLKTYAKTKVSQQYTKYRKKKFAKGNSSSSLLNFGLVDKNALKYLTAVDDLYFGKGEFIVGNPKVAAQLQNWLEEEYIKNGRDIRDPGVFKKFEESFADFTQQVSYRKIEQLALTSMSRVRNFGETFSLYESGIDKYQIVGPRQNAGSRVCDYCANMNGRIFDVGVAAKRLNKVVSKGFEDVGDLPGFLTSEYAPDELANMSDKDLQAAGFDMGPFHPGCTHRATAYFD